MQYKIRRVYKMLQYLTDNSLHKLDITSTLFKPQMTWDEIFLIPLTTEEFRLSYEYKVPYYKWKPGMLEKVEDRDFFFHTGQYMADFCFVEQNADMYERQIQPDTEERYEFDDFMTELEQTIGYEPYPPPVVYDIDTEEEEYELDRSNTTLL